MNYNEEMDYSSLSTYLTCPRKFFFQYILSLRSSGPPSIDLLFGSCWHLGQECAYLYLKSHPEASVTDMTDVATRGFHALWDRDAAPYFDPDATFPKSPNRARDMYYKYYSLFLSQDKECKILGVEEPFTLYISDSVPVYIGRMDLIMERDSHLEIHEHKTSKMSSPIMFTGYDASLQTEGYLTVGHIYYDALPRIMYNQALCQKTKVDHTRYPITKPKHAIDRFLSDYTHYTQRILDELSTWENWMTEGDIYSKRALMPCFHRNAGYACTMYFRPCPYLDLCQMRNNPCTFGESVPEGYTIHEWSPAAHAADSEALRQQVLGSIQL